MTWQDILEGIMRHRANPVRVHLDIPTSLEGTSTHTVAIMLSNDMDRKINEIEWALQAIAERGVGPEVYWLTYERRIYHYDLDPIDFQCLLYHYDAACTLEPFRQTRCR